MEYIDPAACRHPKIESKTGALSSGKEPGQAGQPRGWLQQTWKRGSLEKRLVRGCRGKHGSVWCWQDRRACGARTGDMEPMGKGVRSKGHLSIK